MQSCGQADLQLHVVSSEVGLLVTGAHLLLRKLRHLPLQVLELLLATLPAHACGPYSVWSQLNAAVVASDVLVVSARSG